ncbi:unnamed protein product [Microthlaspi erraticum]|uniref:Uncharacterized protein n=1 Tax=Microthlaspi erraticum TaxID=1685480 RepID=A0A6D2JZQ5_9BRAS|nr:unnamed protein product [Microthlaspi erraticum]
MTRTFGIADTATETKWLELVTAKIQLSLEGQGNLVDVEGLWKTSLDNQRGAKRIRQNRRSNQIGLGEIWAMEDEIRRQRREKQLQGINGFRGARNHIRRPEGELHGRHMMESWRWKPMSGGGLGLHAWVKGLAISTIRGVICKVNKVSKSIYFA